MPCSILTLQLALKFEDAGTSSQANWASAAAAAATAYTCLFCAHCQLVLDFEDAAIITELLTLKDELHVMECRACSTQVRNHTWQAYSTCILRLTL
jgi:hypothetical protein